MCRASRPRNPVPPVPAAGLCEEQQPTCPSTAGQGDRNARQHSPRLRRTPHRSPLLAGDRRALRPRHSTDLPAVRRGGGPDLPGRWDPSGGALLDPDDPTPYVYVSTHAPAQLARVLREAADA
ncbi:DUF3093 family protein [Streptomyces sp. NPDC003442]